MNMHSNANRARGSAKAAAKAAANSSLRPPSNVRAKNFGGRAGAARGQNPAFSRNDK
jgi:hypothetical protein